LIKRASICAVAVAAISMLGASAASAAFTQAVGAGNSLNAISCVPATATCVVADSKGDASYATDVSATAAATWTSWAGPGTGPSWALACPATSLCVLATGTVSGSEGGNVYRANSLGGAFLSAFLPANGVGALSCPSTAFCVSANEGGGFIRYSTKPSGTLWTAVVIGSGAMKGVSCLSPSFCAVVDGSGFVHVATTEGGVKEGAGWKATDVNGGKALEDVACTSTSACIAVDGSDELLALAIAPDGAATATRLPVAGAGRLVALSCAGLTCAAADVDGAIFGSTDGGATWTMRFGGGPEVKGVSCASATLCAGATSAGTVRAFDPTAPQPLPPVLLTGSLPAGAAGEPYEAQLEAEGGTPPYSWSATGLPPGLSVDEASGRISGTPQTAVCVQAPCAQPAATYSPTITVADADGFPASKQLSISLRGWEPPPPPPPYVEPIVTELATSHRSWHLGRGGTTFSFRLNIGAGVTLQFKKRLRGRIRRNGSIFVLAQPGLNQVKFKGRLPNGKLKPGRYILEAAAWGSNGRPTAPVAVNFRILP
jgi:hypothetical protein